MYNAQLTIERFQAEIKRKKETQKHILEECGLNENTFNKMTDKKGISSFSLAKIADKLDCSVDYLLGRTDNPTFHKDIVSNVALGNISNNSGVIGGIGNIAPVTINSNSTEAQAEVLLDTFNSLDPIKQAKLLVYADSLKGEQHEI